MALGNTVSIPLALCTMSDDLKGERGGALLIKFWRHLQQPLIFKGLRMKILGVLEVENNLFGLKFLYPIGN